MEEVRHPEGALTRWHHHQDRDHGSAFLSSSQHIRTPPRIILFPQSSKCYPPTMLPRQGILHSHCRWWSRKVVQPRFRRLMCPKSAAGSHTQIDPIRSQGAWYPCRRLQLYSMCITINWTISSTESWWPCQSWLHPQSITTTHCGCLHRGCLSFQQHGPFVQCLLPGA
jgi:hypothetical protein